MTPCWALRDRRVKCCASEKNIAGMIFHREGRGLTGIERIFSEMNEISGVFTALYWYCGGIASTNQPGPAERFCGLCELELGCCRIFNYPNSIVPNKTNKSLPPPCTYVLQKGQPVQKEREVLWSKDKFFVHELQCQQSTVHNLNLYSHPEQSVTKP